MCYFILDFTNCAPTKDRLLLYFGLFKNRSRFAFRKRFPLFNLVLSCRDDRCIFVGVRVQLFSAGLRAFAESSSAAALD